MQKTLLYLLLLVILGTGVYYFVFSSRNVFGDSEANFTIKDTADIGRIYMARTDGESVTLNRTDTGWVVNGKYKVQSRLMRNLLSTLKRQVTQYPVPENSHNGVITSMAGNSVKVELYDRSNEKIRTFYIGAEASDFGTYMLQEHAQKPYVVHIPGYQGYISPVYTTDIRDWRDRAVFLLKPDEIKSIAVKYPNEPLNSFTLEQNGKTVVHTEPGIPGSNKLNERRADAYLKFFEKVYCEGFLIDVPGMDSTIGSVPKFCIIDVASKKGWQQHVEIYRMPINKRSKNLLTEGDNEYDADRYYAVFNNFKDTSIIQAGSFDKLFRKAYEFYQADEAVNVMGVTDQPK